MGRSAEPALDQLAGLGAGEGRKLHGALEAPEEAHDAPAAVVGVHGGGELAVLGQLVQGGGLGGGHLQALGEEDRVAPPQRLQHQGEHLAHRLALHGAADVPPGDAAHAVGLGAKARRDQVLGHHQAELLVDLLGQVVHQGLGGRHRGPQAGPLALQARPHLAQQGALADPGAALHHHGVARAQGLQDLGYLVIAANKARNLLHSPPP